MARAKGEILQTSLVAKLLTLKPGETLYLDEPDQPTGGTKLDRSVQSVIAKSGTLAGRKFSTSRWIAVQSPAVAKPILAITRTDTP